MLARRIAVTSLFLGQGMHVFLSMQVYRAGESPKFPDGGKMSCHLDSMQIGDTIEAKGPMGHMTYLGRGMCVASLLYSRFRILSPLRCPGPSEQAMPRLVQVPPGPLY